MIVVDDEGDVSANSPNDAKTSPSTTDPSPVRTPSPPPAYSGPSTSAAATSTLTSAQAPTSGPLLDTPAAEWPSAFLPPSPSAFPHPESPQGIAFAAGPTPLLSSFPDGNYTYYDPRSAYSIAMADRRAWLRFWSAFMWAVALLFSLWVVGLLRVDFSG